MSDLLNSDDENRVFSVNAMEETLSSVLQEQAFMFAEYEDALDIAATPTPPYQYARIEFDGPCSGRLGLVFPHSLLSELIGNMLGLEIDEVEQEDVPDALMELLNVVCGKFLVASFGSAVKFNLAIPTVSQMDASDWETQKRKSNTTVLLVEGEPVLFELSL